MGSGGYPYDEKLKKKDYEKELLELQLELSSCRTTSRSTSERLVVLFEGRDASGKGSCISRFLGRSTRGMRAPSRCRSRPNASGAVVLPALCRHLPTAGRYRAVRPLLVQPRRRRARHGLLHGGTDERVPRDAPDFEALLVRDGIRFFKFYLASAARCSSSASTSAGTIRSSSGRSPTSISPRSRSGTTTREAQHDIFRFTHTAIAPWTVIRANDQRRARLEAIRMVLSAIAYDGKDEDAVGEPDPLIVGSGPEFFAAD